MSAPRVRSGRITRIATVLMIVLGVLTIFVNDVVAAIIIALGVAMYLFEWWLVRKVARTVEEG